MSTTIERLLVIQDRDRRITQLAREQSDIPKRIAEVETRLHVHRDSLTLAQETLKKSQSSIKQIEVEVESHRQRIAKHREQQFQIKSNVEYKTLEHEIEVLQKKIRELEDQELVVMEQMEQNRASIAEREKDLKLEEKRVLEDQSVFTKRMDAIQSEIRDLTVDRDALAKDVDVNWLARYDRIYKKTGDFALVPVEKNACGGCHMNLPPHMIHEAKKGLNLTLCNYCNRILYWQP